MYDLIIKNGKLVTPDRIFEADVAIKDGKYAAIVAPGSDLEAKEVIDANGNYVYPGIIDCHAHLNEPGFEYREDFETGSRAAAVAGCTTLIDMPLNNDPSLMNKEIFDLKMCKISKHSVVDYALWGGIVGDYNNEPGSVKNTYGTGCFLLMNSGERPIMSSNNLLTTVAWKIGDTVNYALEGSIFVAGSVVQWLRDGLGIIKSSSEVEELAASVPDNGGVYFVPALTGLGAPHWDQYAKGSIYGLSRGTTAAHIARAALEGIAFQTMDIVNAMQKDAGVTLKELKVDGGASRNNLLMQFQADVLGTSVIRPTVTETTALGAAYLAGLAVGYWESLDHIKSQWGVDTEFTPKAAEEDVNTLKEGWADAIRRTLTNK